MAVSGRYTFYDEDDDVSDDAFLNYRNPNRAMEEKQEHLLEEKRQTENRTLESSNRALRAIYESEQIGIETAEELNRQGEQLRKVDRNLDDINATMRTSQKHLTAMNSFTSVFKSYFSKSKPVSNNGPKGDDSPDTEQPSQSKLISVVSQVREEGEKARIKNHPALRQRGLVDTSGFGAAFGGDDEDDEESCYPTTAKAQTAKPLSRSQIVDKKLDNDLKEISHGLTRLKTLANGLNPELDDQLTLLNDINTKADKAEGTIAFQNGQMNRLLKR